MPTIAELANKQLAAFLAQYKAPRGTQQPITHTLITKPFGRYQIPAGRLHEFNSRYAQVLIQGFNPGFVEIKPKGMFRLFVDLDLKLALGAVLSQEEKLALLVTVHKLAVSMFGASSVRVAACLPYAKGGLTKSGLHMVWPTVFVSRKDVTAFRQACIAALCQSQPLACFHGDWESVVDGAVYNEGTGLRMIGAAKQEPAATVYLPDCVLDGSGMLEQQVACGDLSDIAEWLQQSSLCVQMPVGGKAAAPSIASVKPEPIISPARPGKARASSGASYKLHPSRCPELVEAVRTVISRKDAAEFKTSAVRSLELYPAQKGSTHPMAVVVVDSKRCLNLRGRDCHHSNHSYLVVQHDRVCQRCHSEQSEQVRYGPCKSFNLDISPHPSRAHEALVSLDDYKAAKQRLPMLLQEALAKASTAA